MGLRQAAGESVDPHEYHDRFPKDADQVAAAVELNRLIFLEHAAVRHFLPVDIL